MTQLKSLAVLPLIAAAFCCPRAEALDFWTDVLPKWKELESDFSSIEASISVHRVGAKSDVEDPTTIARYARCGTNRLMVLERQSMPNQVFAINQDYNFLATGNSLNLIDKSNLTTTQSLQKLESAVFAAYSLPCNKLTIPPLTQYLSPERQTITTHGDRVVEVKDSNFELTLELSPDRDFRIDHWELEFGNTVHIGRVEYGSTNIPTAVYVSSRPIDSLDRNRRVYFISDVARCSTPYSHFLVEHYGIEPPLEYAQPARRWPYVFAILGVAFITALIMRRKNVS